MVGRRPFGLVYTVLFIGVVVAWFSGRIAWWVAFLVWGGAWLAGLLVQRSARGPVPEVELGPVEFSAGVWVRARPAAFNTWGYGFVRLLVGAGTVATRTRFFPRGVGKLFGTDYTLRAADFEVGTAVHVGSSSRSGSGGWGPGRVIRPSGTGPSCSGGRTDAASSSWSSSVPRKPLGKSCSGS